ncbi:MAG TPA: YwhD family protein [Thermaerobacter sp.]
MAPRMDPTTHRPDERGRPTAQPAQPGGPEPVDRVPAGAAPAADAPMRLPLVGARKGSHSHLGGLAAILVDGERAEVAPAALHAKSRVEQGVRWVDDPAQVPAGRQYWVVWIAQGGAGGRGIRGAVASPMWIDRQAMVGYKHLAGHVNDMSRAMKGVVDLSGLTAAQRKAVGEAIRARAPQVWEATDPAIRAQLGGDAVGAASDAGGRSS